MARSKPTAFQAVSFQLDSTRTEGWLNTGKARDLIREICEAREVVILGWAVLPDHIHMLLPAPPHRTPI